MRPIPGKAQEGRAISGHKPRFGLRFDGGDGVQSETFEP